MQKVISVWLRLILILEMTSHSLFPKSAATVGISFEQPRRENFGVEPVMNILKRKTPQNIRFGEQSLNIIFIFGLLRYCLVSFFTGVYFNWQSILEKMDDKPISAFALVGQKYLYYC